MGGVGSGRRKGSGGKGSGGVTVEDIDHGWDKVMREIKKLDGSYTAVGYFGHGGNPSDDIAARAAVNELGATIRVTKKMRGYLA